MRVAVAGAGIGGLLLAQGLRRQRVDVAVYERDASLDARAQGYRLHLDAGAALSACLPPDLYELCIATSGQPSTSMTVMTASLRILRRIDVGPPAVPNNPGTLSTSVNRQTFREILAARLDDVIEYGRAVTGFDQDADRVRVTFEDGSQTDADVLVAADGIGSPIRHQYLPHARVEETGTICVFGRTPLTDRTRPLVPAPLWTGFTAVVGGSLGMATGVLDFREPPQHAARRLAPDARLGPAEPYLMWALTGAAKHFPAHISAHGPVDMHAAALRAIRRWHPDLRRLVELATIADTSLIPIRTAVPVDAWPASRVTLLGDAIHAMSPARGSGANTALRDAALLAANLGAARRGEVPVIAAIADYEGQMREYAFAAVRASREAEVTTTIRGTLMRRLLNHDPARG